MSPGKPPTTLYDKRDDFDSPVGNFPFLSSNISSGSSYGVYILQLLRYIRNASNVTMTSNIVTIEVCLKANKLMPGDSSYEILGQMSRSH